MDNTTLAAETQAALLNVIKQKAGGVNLTPVGVKILAEAYNLAMLAQPAIANAEEGAEAAK